MRRCIGGAVAFVHIWQVASSLLSSYRKCALVKCVNLECLQIDDQIGLHIKLQEENEGSIVLLGFKCLTLDQNKGAFVSAPAFSENLFSSNTTAHNIASKH